MNTRVPDNSTSTNFISRINSQRGRVSILQERIATGRRINRPSDDPSGAEMVLNLRTSQAEIGQFRRNAQAANQRLTAADDTLSGYETILDRVKTLISQGLSGTATPQTRASIAAEVESLRSRVLATANSKNGEDYLFGGTRQGTPPYDPVTGAAAAAVAAPQHIQIEPGASAIATGVTADTVFGDSGSTIFADLTAAVTALHGTGDSAADDAALKDTMIRLEVYSGLASTAHAKIGANMNAVGIVTDNLSANFLSLDQRVDDIQNADFAETAVGLADAQRSLDATLQVAAQGRRSLFDFIG